MNSTKFTCIFVWICGFYVILLASKVNAETIKRFPYPPKPPKKNVTNTDNKTPKAVNGTNDKSTDAKKAAHVLQESNDLESIFKRHYTLVKKCFDSKKVIRSEKQARDLKTILSYNSTYDPVIEVDNWIDEIDAANIITLTHCVKLHSPDNYNYRPFGGSKYGGGNNVTFLNQFFQAIDSEMLEHVVSVAGAVADGVGWRPHPHHLGIRCIELLEYEKMGELLWHLDHESVYTISIMLSNATEFEGGNFIIENRLERDMNGLVNTTNVTVVKSKQYGGVMFDSEVPHAVSSIVDGKRTVLVLELWPFADAGFDDERPPASKVLKSQKVPKLLRVPVAPEPKKKGVFHTMLDVRDRLVLCVGILLGLLLALFLLELEDLWRNNAVRKGASPSNLKSKNGKGAEKRSPSKTKSQASSPTTKKAPDQKTD